MTRDRDEDPHRQHSPRAPRLMRGDLEILNAALALMEAEVEGEEPDAYREDAAYEEEYQQWAATLSEIRAVRGKIWHRLE